MELNRKVKELEVELETRDECETKVQDYVKTLVSKNKDLQSKID